MELNRIKRIVSNKQNGSFTSLLWERELPLRKENRGVHTVTKRSRAVVRFGVNYDNMGAVKEKRETGELPKENAGLPWGKWETPNLIIEHNEKHYLRCATSHANRPNTEYFLDGKKVSREEIEELCLKSAFSNEEHADVFNVNCDNILAIE